MPVGSRTPPGVVHLHKFNALGIPADFNAPEETGDTTVTALSDGLHIKNTGAGAAGVSYMRSDLHFGRQILFNIVASLVSGSSPANGEHAELFLELYEDSLNWVKFGPYRDASESVNTLAFVRWSLNGVVTTASASVDVLDAAEHAYSILVSEKSLGFYLDYQLVYSIPLDNVITTFLLGIGGGTQDATDVLDAAVASYTFIESADPALLDLLYAVSTISGGGSSSSTALEEFTDFFDDASIDPNIWGSPQTQGSTTVVETGGNIKISNPGTGTAGTSRLRSIRTFTGLGHFSVDFESISRTLAANSTLRQSIGIYIDANNWVKWGLIDKTSAPINNVIGFLEYCIGGVTSSVTLVSTDIDATRRTYSVEVLEDKVRVALNGIYYGEVAFTNVESNYTVQLEAGSDGNTDVFDCYFDDFVFRSWIDSFQLSLAGGIEVCLNNLSALLARLTSTRAGYLDAIPDIDMIDTYLGTDRITGNDGAQSVTLPTDTNVVVIAAEGGAVRYEINGTASAASAGFVPQNELVVLAVGNLTSLSIYAATGAYANCVCYQRG